jgi:hypothetical protein
LVDELDVDQIAIKTSPLDRGSPQLRPTGRTTTVQPAATMKFADVDAIDRQFFDCYSFSAVLHLEAFR